MSDLSPAQAIFKDKEIITARPPDMDFEEYKSLRRVQGGVLKKLFAKEPMYKVRRSRIKSKKKK